MRSIVKENYEYFDLCFHIILKWNLCSSLNMEGMCRIW